MTRRGLLLALAVSAATAVTACSNGDQGSAEKLCAAVRADPSASTVFADFDPSDAPHALEQLRAARVTLGELRRAAPKEVRGELDIEIAYVQDLIDGLSADKGLDASQAADIVRTITAKHPDVSTASATLEAYNTEHCTSG